jgi:hypothetical protein
VVPGFDSSSFTAADGAGLPATDSGRAWSFGALGAVPTFGISSNRACITSTAAGSPAYAYVDVGVTNITAQLTLTTVSSVAGMLVAYADDNNYVYSTQLQLSKIIGGSFTTVQSYGGSSFTTGDVMKIGRSGTTFTIYKNGSLIFTKTVADAGVASTTKTGFLFAGTDTTSRIDDWSVVTP